MTLATRSPEALAAAWGIIIIYRPLTTAAAIWLLDHWTIVVHDGLTLAEQQEAIAHSLGHAKHFHTECTPSTDRAVARSAEAPRYGLFHPLRHIAAA